MKAATTYKFRDEFKSRIQGREIARIVRTYGLAGSGILTLPIGRQELIPTNYEIVDQRSVVPIIFPEISQKYILRQSQQDTLNAVEDNCMINAPVSWGKTFTALHIAKKLGQKTLIVTHTTLHI